MKVGLFFGSFNPIHVGHLILANHFAQYGDVDQVWLIVSPHNPLKLKNTLLADYHRLAMVEAAIENNPKLKASNIEFSMPQPNYTILTLVKLKEKYPDYQFRLIMGEDNLKSLHKWYNYEQIIEGYKILVYPRNTNFKSPFNEKEYPNITVLRDVPLMNISSSFIRKAIKEKKDVSYLLTESVKKYIDEMNFYK